MAITTENPTILQRVEQAIDTVRPYLKTDGGDIEIVEITKEMIVHVRLLGACVTCPMSFSTMKAGIEANVISAVPEIKGVKAINVDLPE